MFTVSIWAQAQLEACESLKEKRSIVRSMLAEFRRIYKASAAEVGTQDQPHTMTLGLALVASDMVSAQRRGQMIEQALYRDTRFPTMEVKVQIHKQG